VVIAIIAILAAILFPVFAKAREKARQTSCLSNCKQAALAVEMYSQDFDEMIVAVYNESPASRWWFDVLQPYMNNRQIQFCPSRPRQDPGYAYNYPHGSYRLKYPATIKSMADIKKPAAQMLFLDNENTNSWYRRYAYCYVRWQGIRTPHNVVGDRHNGGPNCGFLDGHAKWLNLNTILDKNNKAFWGHP